MLGREWAVLGDWQERRVDVKTGPTHKGPRVHRKGPHMQNSIAKKVNFCCRGSGFRGQKLGQVCEKNKTKQNTNTKWPR